MSAGRELSRALRIANPGGASLHPIIVNRGEVALALAFGVVALVFTYPPPGGLIHLWRGGLLLLLYAVYLGVILRQRAGA